MAAARCRPERRGPPSTKTPKRASSYPQSTPTVEPDADADGSGDETQARVPDLPTNPIGADADGDGQGGLCGVKFPTQSRHAWVQAGDGDFEGGHLSCEVSSV